MILSYSQKYQPVWDYGLKEKYRFEKQITKAKKLFI